MFELIITKLWMTRKAVSTSKRPCGIECGMWKNVHTTDQHIAKTAVQEFLDHLIHLQQILIVTDPSTAILRKARTLLTTVEVKLQNLQQ